MGFLAPALLAFGIVVAVPVWLHLTRRPPSRRRAFPSLAFVDEATLRATRRRSIRDPLLLAIRVLAIALLVAAFARPFLREATGAGDGDAGREIVLLLDRSYSMAGGGRMERARAAAREAFSGLAEGDRLTLVAFDDGARALGPASRDVDALTAQLDSVRPGEGGTSYATGLRLAESILAASPGSRREVVVVSDFVSGEPTRDAPVRLPPGTTLRLVLAGGDPVDDLAVSEVTLRRAGFAAGERVHVLARVRNAGDAPVERRAVTLMLDGARVAQDAVSLEPGAVTSVEFPAFSLASGAATGVVRVAGDDVSANDARWFVAEPRRVLDVLIVEPDGSGPRRGIHLRRALELGRSPTFALRRRTPRSLRPDDFSGPGVVILDGVPFPAGETGDRLRAFVSSGGGLIAVAGDAAKAPPESAEGLLPREAGKSVTRPEGAALGRIEYGHPVFAPFRDPGSGDLGAARFDRYRRFDDGGMRVLARFDDGAPALLEAEAGLGRAMLWTTSIGDAWNDLPLQPVFLPFVHRLLLHAASWDERAPSREVGASVDPAELVPPGAAGDEPPVLVTPDGTRVALDPAGSPLPLDRSGIYEVREPGSAVVSRFAANVDPAESGTAAVDTAGLALSEPGEPALAGPGQPSGAVPAPSPEGPDREPGRALWWPLLLAASVLFLVEGVLSNARGGRAPIGGSP